MPVLLNLKNLLIGIIKNINNYGIYHSESSTITKPND